MKRIVRSIRMPVGFVRAAVAFVALVATTAAQSDGRTADGFRRAVAARRFAFPADHGSHPDFKTEWWYFTGVLTTGDGDRLGFQATWFRTGLVPNAPKRKSRLAARDVYFFHGAVCDAGRDRFDYVHRISRGAVWAGASENTLDVRLLDATARRDDDGTWRLEFTVRGRRFALRLAPTRAPLLHGRVPGLSAKGSRPGQASYYYSHTRLRVDGSVAPADDPGSRRAVRGAAWFDHEFGSAQLDDGHTGWDWFSVALDDGTDLMLYGIRDGDGRPAPTSAGTLRAPAGTGVLSRIHLGHKDFSVDVLDWWTSPHSAARYPARWRLRVPAQRIDLTVVPARADQELRTRGTTGVTYWEGMCRFRGHVGDRPVDAWGYVELVGYAGPFGRRI